MKRYCKITTNTPDETVVTGLSEPWILLDKSETGKDNFIFQRSINNLTLDLCEGNINTVENFVNRDEEHALMCIKNKDNTYTVIYKKEKTELSPDYPLSIYQYCKNIILPNSITKINSGTFKNCINLENITLPNSISEIGNNVFYGCASLTTIKIPNRVKRISEDLFNGCTNLTQVYIPNNIHYISETAFNECINLNEVILYNGLTNNEEHFTVKNGEINIPYYDEDGEQKTICININNNTKPEEWELYPLTPDNNVILYKTSSGNKYNFDDNTNTSYVEGYTINDEGTHSKIVKLGIVNHDEEKDIDGYRIEFTQNTNISKIIGGRTGAKQWFYFESTDLTEIYLPVSVTDINNCVFNTPNLSTLLLPPNISLKKCKLPDDEENGVHDQYVEVLYNCGKLKYILYNGTSKEFMDIISSEDTASRTWYKDLPHEFIVSCFDKDLNLENNFNQIDPDETTSNNDDPNGTTSDNVGDSTSDNNDGPNIPGGSEDIGDSTSDNNDGPEGGDNTSDSTSDNNDGPEGGDNTGDSTSDNNDGPEGGDNTGDSTSDNNDGPEGDSTSDNNDGPEGGDNTGESTSDNNDGPEGGDNTGDSTSDNNDGPNGGDDTGDSTSDNNDGPEGGDDTGESTSDNNDGPNGDDITENKHPFDPGDFGEKEYDDITENKHPFDPGDFGKKEYGDGGTGDNGDNTTSDNNDGPEGIDDVNFNETEYNPNINEPGTKKYGERDIIL